MFRLRIAYPHFGSEHRLQMEMGVAVGSLICVSIGRQRFPMFYPEKLSKGLFPIFVRSVGFTGNVKNPRDQLTNNG